MRFLLACTAFVVGCSKQPTAEEIAKATIDEAQRRMQATADLGPPYSIDITSTPPKARVFVDGKRQRVDTPLRATLSNERHVLRLESPGYITFTATVTEDSPKKLHADLVRTSTGP